MVVLLFVDDIGIKGPKTTYDDELKFEGVRRFVFEHFENVLAVLSTIHASGLTLAADKFELARSSATFVGYLVTQDGRFPYPVKMEKLRIFNYIRDSCSRLSWNDCVLHCVD